MRFPMREAGGETHRQPADPAAPAHAAHRCPRHEMDPGWHADRAPRGFMREPYADAPGHAGRMNLSGEPARPKLSGWAYGSEDPLLVHAVGDAAIDAYLCCARSGRAAGRRGGSSGRASSTATCCRRISGARQSARRGGGAEPRAFHVPRGLLAGAYGAERGYAWMQPMKSLIDGRHSARHWLRRSAESVSQHHVCLHASRPIRREALTREQAVMAYTRGSAFSEFAEREKGQLAVGMLADLAVLSADVFTVPHRPDWPRFEA